MANDRRESIGSGCESGAIAALNRAAENSRTAGHAAGERNDGIPVIDDLVTGNNASNEEKCIDHCERTLQQLHEAWNDIANYQDVMGDKLSQEQLEDLQGMCRRIGDAERDCAQVLKTIDPDNPYFDPGSSNLHDYYPDKVEPLSDPPDWGNIEHRLGTCIPIDIDLVRRDFQREFDGFARNPQGQRNAKASQADGPDRNDLDESNKLNAENENVESAAEFLANGKDPEPISIGQGIKETAEDAVSKMLGEISL